MPTEVWRPGDYRICPSCRARHKVQDIKCNRCGTVLVGLAVQHAGPASVTAAGSRSGRGIRAILALALLVALGAGLWVRSMFRGAPLQEGVEANEARALPAPSAPPTWTPPVLSYPPVVGYNSAAPAGATSLASPTASAAPADPATTMTSIAPPSEPTAKTVFTNEDLERVRGGSATMGAPQPGLATMAPPPTRAAGSQAAVPDDETRQWIERVRDDEDKVQDAQAKVRRLQAEVEVLRAQAAALSADRDAQDKAQRDLDDRLDELEKAERKLSAKQRDLDDTKDRARAAGVRF